MTSKNPFLQKYNTIAKFYNQVWLIAILLAVGLFIMQIATGNLTQKKETTNFQEFGCYQTPDNKLIKLEEYEPQTNTELSIIEFDQVIRTKLRVNEIPPINEPKFSQNHDEILKCIDEEEKAIVLEGSSETKIYPFKILQQHLVINDFIDNKPILVSICALCNSPSVYERTIDSKELAFGTTGLLYRNNDLFFDDSTNSLWSQINGKAVVGDSVGQNLSRINFKTMSLKNAVLQYSESNILTFDTGYRRNYSDSSFKDYEKSDTTLSPVLNSSDKFAKKDTVYAFEIDEQIYAMNSADAEKEDFRIKTPNDIQIKTIYENGITRLFVNDQETQYIQSYWYVWYDHYPETIALKP